MKTKWIEWQRDRKVKWFEEIAKKNKPSKMVSRLCTAAVSERCCFTHTSDVSSDGKTDDFSWHRREPPSQHPAFRASGKSTPQAEDLCRQVGVKTISAAPKLTALLPLKPCHNSDAHITQSRFCRAIWKGFSNISGLLLSLQHHLILALNSNDFIPDNLSCVLQ